MTPATGNRTVESPITTPESLQDEEMFPYLAQLQIEVNVRKKALLTVFFQRSGVS